MSYVLAILKHLAKSKYCQNSYSAKNIVDLRKVSRKKTLAIQRNKQNKNYDAEKKVQKVSRRETKKGKIAKKYQFQHCCSGGHGRYKSQRSSNTVKAYVTVSNLRQYFFDTTYFHLLLGLRSQSSKS